MYTLLWRHYFRYVSPIIASTAIRWYPSRSYRRVFRLQPPPCSQLCLVSLTSGWNPLILTRSDVSTRIGQSRPWRCVFILPNLRYGYWSFTRENLKLSLVFRYRIRSLLCWIRNQILVSLLLWMTIQSNSDSMVYAIGKSSRYDGRGQNPSWSDTDCVVFR